MPSDGGGRSAKDIRVEPIRPADSKRVIEALHYSGKAYKSSLHLGVFLDGVCGGAMTFGAPMDSRRAPQLVRNTRRDQMCELNRMALADWLPRNGESRALAMAMRYLRRNEPRVRWVLSFADGTQCGDGTIYRAAGFALTGIKKNTTLWRAPDGEVVSHLGLCTSPALRARYGVPTAARVRQLRAAGLTPLPGYQLRYVYFLDPKARDDLTVPILPFSEIDTAGARMYRGTRPKRGKPSGAAPGHQPGKGGSIPTPALHPPARGGSAAQAQDPGVTAPSGGPPSTAADV